MIAAAPDIEPASCFYPSQGLNLHYLDWGNAGAPLLVLLHGSRDHARSWDWTARALRDRWHVIAADLRGHGDSAASPDGAYLTPYHVLDLATLIDVLGEERATIIGHSFGGNISWRYAALFPDRVGKLVVVDGLGPSPRAMEKWAAVGPLQRSREWIGKRRDSKATTPRPLATVEEAIARMAAANPNLSDAQVRHLAAQGIRPDGDSYRWKYDPRVSMFTPEDFAIDGPNFWREVQAPTLICYGTESWTENPEADGRAAHFRDYRTVPIEKAGHWPHHDRLDDFLRALNDFL